MLQENTTINKMTLAGNEFDEKAAVPIAEIITVSLYYHRSLEKSWLYYQMLN